MKDLLKKVSDLAYQASEEVYDDDKENGTAGILSLCDKLYEKIDNYLARIDEETISKEVIADAIEKGVIEFNDDDEYGCMGLHCKIGCNGFYFGGDANIPDMTLDEFNKAFSQDEVVDMLYDCLSSEYAAEQSGLDNYEYESYRTILEDIYSREAEI